MIFVYSRQSDSSSTVPISRAELYENAPKLPEDVLQQLLTEARQTLGSSAPSTTRVENSSQGNIVVFSLSYLGKTTTVIYSEIITKTELFSFCRTNGSRVSDRGYNS